MGKLGTRNRRERKAEADSDKRDLQKMKREEILAWTGAFAASIADIVTTIVGLNMGIGEKHPVADTAIESVGVVYGLTAITAISLICIIFLWLISRRIWGSKLSVAVPISWAVMNFAFSFWNTFVISVAVS